MNKNIKTLIYTAISIVIFIILIFYITTLLSTKMPKSSQVHALLVGAAAKEIFDEIKSNTATNTEALIPALDITASKISNGHVLKIISINDKEVVFSTSLFSEKHSNEYACKSPSCGEKIIMKYKFESDSTISCRTEKILPGVKNCIVESPTK